MKASPRYWPVLVWEHVKEFLVDGAQVVLAIMAIHLRSGIFWIVTAIALALAACEGVSAIGESLDWTVKDNFMLAEEHGRGWRGVRGDTATTRFFVKRGETRENWSERAGKAPAMPPAYVVHNRDEMRRAGGALRKIEEKSEQLSFTFPIPGGRKGEKRRAGSLWESLDGTAAVK